MTLFVWEKNCSTFFDLQAVTRPIDYMNLTRISALCLIGFVWLISFCICIPGLLSVRYDICKTEGSNALSVFHIQVAFYLPFIIVVMCYLIVFVRLKQKIDKKVIAKMEHLERLSKKRRGTQVSVSYSDLNPNHFLDNRARCPMEFQRGQVRL